MAALTTGLFVLLLPEWFERQWLIYPLPRPFVQIAENLFWAFTTSTLFMLFENSVNGGASLMEKYRDIADRTDYLPSPVFSHDFLTAEDIPVEGGQRAEFESNLRIANTADDPLAYLIRSWGHFAKFEKVHATRDEYLEYLTTWQRIIHSNSAYFMPDSLDASEIKGLRLACANFADELNGYSEWCFTDEWGFWHCSGDIGLSFMVNTNDPAPESVAETWDILTEPFYDYLKGQGREGFSANSLPFDHRTTQLVDDNGQVVAQLVHCWPRPVPRERAQFLYRAVERERPTVHEPDFWTTKPRDTVEAETLLSWLRTMTGLSRRVDQYNTAYKADLALARGYALAEPTPGNH